MKRIMSIGIIISVMLLAVSCSRKHESTTSVRIAYFPNITHSQALVMKELNSLDDKLANNCKVSWHSFNAGPEEIEAMFAGEIDLGYIGPVPAINANVKSKGDVKIIANACNNGTVFLKAKNANISSISDLEGKIVAVPQFGNTQHVCLLNILEKSGLSVKSDGGSVDVVAVANANMRGMLEQGKIDAALVPEPWGSVLEENCGAKAILDYDEIFESDEYPVAVIIVNNDFYKKHKDIVQAFLKAHKETTTYINTHKNEAVEIINRQLEETIGKSIETKIIYQSFERLCFDENISEEAIIKFSEIEMKLGFISEQPTLKDLIVFSITDDIK